MCKQACQSCAFTVNSDAHREPQNNLKAQLCLLGGLPFYCHHGVDWQSPRLEDVSVKEARRLIHEEGFTICAGWQREVKALAATGYYRDQRGLIKVFGQIGLQQLQAFSARNADKEEKATALRILRVVLRRLVKRQEQFEKAA